MQRSLAARLESLLGTKILEAASITARTGNARGHWRLKLADGRSLFAKAGYDGVSATWVRTEAVIYVNVRAGCLPRLVAHEDDLLVLEDLSQTYFPPPWRDGDVAAVFEALHELGEVEPPAGLPRLDEIKPILIDTGWMAVEADPRPFLALNLCSPRWLNEVLPNLISAARAVPLEGTRLVHADIRSDNLCFRTGRALLFDWNQASVGNPLFDLAEWLPSLAAEGGPQPEEIMPGSVGAPFAAALSGLWLAHSTRPSPPGLPNLRAMQRTQGEAAFAWAIRSLGLPRID